MSQSKYHKEQMVNVGTEKNPKMIPRRRAVRVLQDVKAKDGTDIVLSSDRIYIKNPDGSLRRTVPKKTKKERRAEREAANAAG